MKEASDLIACVVDHSLFLPIAQKLSETYKQVYYWTPWDDCFPTVKKGLIGDGFDNLERVDSIWKVKKDVDLFVFPDVGFSGLQLELESQGFPVWGSREADSLETNRGKFLREIAELGMPVPKYKTITGLTKLREYLRDRTDKWVKVSKWRGDVETFHWRDWAQDEGTLDFYAYKLGAVKEQFQFYVLDPIDTDIEDGIDTYCINGQLPKTCIHGMERKDQSYLCTVAAMADIPEQVRSVSEQFAPVLAQYNYRSFFSTEVRIAGDQSYFIDPTLRSGSPPSQVMTELYGNLAEIIWQGANGECIEPEPAAEFGAQVLLKAKGDKSAWSVVDIPKELRQWVKCGGACEIDDKLCFPPDERDGCDLGWLVAIGDTIQETIATLKEHAAKLPDGVECDITSLAHLLEEVHEAEAAGMEFTDQTVPEPESVISNGD